MVILKTKEEIEGIRKSGHILAQVLRELREYVREGITTWALNKVAEDMVRKLGGRPAFKGYKPGFSDKKYPFATCISINDEIVHGLPSKRRVLREGDIVSIDMGVNYKGFFSDAAVTYKVGRVAEEVERLLEVTKEALYLGISKAYPGNRVGDISYAIGSFVKSHGFQPVRDYCGHGVGKRVHEDPSVPNDGVPGTGDMIKVGMTLAIEPMVSMGSPDAVTKEDGWTAVTKDGSLAAHFEHTIAVLEDGPEILTPWDEDA